MRKFSWLLGAVLATSVLAGGITLYKFGALAEFGEQDRDGGPPDGDYWAVRAGVTSTVGKIDPLGLVKAAKQERTMAVATPEGKRTYSRAIAHSLNSPLTLDPDHFINLGPMPENNTQQSFNHVSGRVNVDRRRSTTTTTPTTSPPTSAPTAAASGRRPTAVREHDVDSENRFPGNRRACRFPISSSIRANHNVIYAGTGDLNYGSFSFGAAGVLKSTDRRRNMELHGADVFTPFYAAARRIRFRSTRRSARCASIRTIRTIVIGGHQDRSVFLLRRRQELDRPVLHESIRDRRVAQRQDITGLLPVDNGDGTTRVVRCRRHARRRRRRCSPISSITARTAFTAIDEMPAAGCPESRDWTLLATAGRPAPATASRSAARQNTLPAPTQSAHRNRVCAEQSVAHVCEAQASPTRERRTASTQRRRRRSLDELTRTDQRRRTHGLRRQRSSNGGAQMWYDAGLTRRSDQSRTRVHEHDRSNLSLDGGGNFLDVTCGYGNHANPAASRVHVTITRAPSWATIRARCSIGSDGGVYYSSAMPHIDDRPHQRNNMNWIAHERLDQHHRVLLRRHHRQFRDVGYAGHWRRRAGQRLLAAHFAGTPTGPAIMERDLRRRRHRRRKIEPIINQIWFNSSQNGSLGRSIT